MLRGCTFIKGYKVNQKVTFELKNEGGKGLTQPCRYLGEGFSTQREQPMQSYVCIDLAYLKAVVLEQRTCKKGEVIEVPETKL